jgi:predicted murein hydrolase (TIGR00659 family)
MKELLTNSVYFGFFLTLIIYFFGVYVKNKTKIALFNPLLISSILIICILLFFKIDYGVYEEGAKYISYFLTPVTICLAVPLYKQLDVLKKNFITIISSVLVGCLYNVVVISILFKIFSMSNEMAISILPKSITTPIAIGVSEGLGGVVSITVFAVILTGIFGATVAPYVLKIFRIKNDVAQGLACGTAAHSAGTASAMELGEVQGAMSGLAIIITGLMTVALVPIVISLFFS